MLHVCNELELSFPFYHWGIYAIHRDDEKSLRVAARIKMFDIWPPVFPLLIDSLKVLANNPMPDSTIYEPTCIPKPLASVGMLARGGTTIVGTDGRLGPNAPTASDALGFMAGATPLGIAGSGALGGGAGGPRSRAAAVMELRGM